MLIGACRALDCGLRNLPEGASLNEHRSETAPRPRVVVVGAGFGGIALAKGLARQPLDVLLLDRNNYHTFQPLLYQVATGGLEPDRIAYPVRRIFRRAGNVRFQLCEVLRVDSDAKQVITDTGPIDYDYLVLATGSTNNFFQFAPVQGQMMRLKSLTDALDLRSYLMQNLEAAITAADDTHRGELLSVAIIGGGPTGIELAGALAEMKAHVLPKDFPQIDFSAMAINLYEAAPRLLSAMSERSSHYAERDLKKLGVNVFLNAKVERYEAGRLYLADEGKGFRTDCVIWTAGVKANPVPGLSADVQVANQRLKVDANLRLENHPSIFVIGDLAANIAADRPRGHPMLATVAMQEGSYLAAALPKLIAGQSVLPFTYHDRGTMATIGRNKAVVDLPRMHFHGTPAWFVWMFVHLLSLVGFRNRFVALVNWASNYFTYDRPLGLIVRPYRRQDLPGNTPAPTPASHQPRQP